MDHFNRARHVENPILGRAKIGSNLNGEDRPDPFPSREQAVPHRSMQNLGVLFDRRNQLTEPLLDSPAQITLAIPVLAHRTNR
jgi:hypothetical protein